MWEETAKTFEHEKILKMPKDLKTHSRGSFFAEILRFYLNLYTKIQENSYTHYTPESAAYKSFIRAIYIRV